MKRTTRSLIITSTTLVLGLSVLLFQDKAKAGPDEKEKTRKKFKQLDRDNSGLLERNEFPGDDQLFQRADRNGNGLLEFEEVLNFVIEQEVEKIFMTWDKDRDGFIRREEITDPRHRKNFDWVDKDNDDRLSGAELLAAVRAKFNGQLPNKPAQAGSSVKGLKLPPKWNDLMAAKDHNGDGKLTQAELGAPAATFEKLDPNKDGVITEGEFKPLRKRVVSVMTKVHTLQKLMKRHGDDIGKALKQVDVDKAEAALDKLLKELKGLEKSSSSRKF